MGARDGLAQRQRDGRRPQREITCRTSGVVCAREGYGIAGDYGNAISW